MKKIINVLTATRAEYGLLKPIIQKLNPVSEFDVRVVATGMHLSPEYGLTYQEIEEDGIPIDKKIEILLSSDTPSAISKTMGIAMISFADYFDDLKPDLLIVLGDRYETLAVCCAAMNARIPIAHLYGGEITEGAVDDCIRHAITKMSYLHFTSTSEYRKRVIQLGEAPERVYEVGAMGIENALRTKLLTKEQLEESLQIKLDKPYAIITYHPVTLEDCDEGNRFMEILKACESFKDMIFIFTKANSDANGRVINRMIDQYVAGHANSAAFTSLGMLRYLSALKYGSMVIGNSSSGLAEAPAFHIPTINIGNRQKGRLQGLTIINCNTDQIEIEKAITLAKSEEFKLKIKDAVNPYGDGNTSDKVLEIIKKVLLNQEIDLKKQFYNIDIEVS